MSNTDLYQEFQKMSIPAIPTIDAERTAKRLRYLRHNNINLKNMCAVIQDFIKR